MPRSIPRVEIERQIAELARSCGWRHHHPRAPGRTADGYVDGFPTEVLLRGGTLVLATLSSPRGKLSAPELAWIEELGRVSAVEPFLVDETTLPELARKLVTGELRRTPTPRPGRTR